MVHEALLLRNRGASGPSSGRRVETLRFCNLIQKHAVPQTAFCKTCSEKFCNSE